MLFRSLIGLSTLGLLITAWGTDLFEKGAQEKALWLLHIVLGYVLCAALLARIAWGLIGPKYARFSAHWHPLEWRQTLRNFRLKPLREHKALGHYPPASAVYLAVYLILVTMVVTGLLLAAIEHGMGPFTSQLYDHVWLKTLFKEPHEVGSYALVGFIALHLAALIWHETKDKMPIAQSMISGYQYQHTQENGDSHES